MRQAGEILSERTEDAPHLDRDPEFGSTLNTLSRALGRMLLEESAEWDRIRNERAERDRRRDIDRSQNRGLS